MEGMHESWMVRGWEMFGEGAAVLGACFLVSLLNGG